MKKIPLLIIAIYFLPITQVFAQRVTDLVRFDTYISPSNNDMVNNFSNTGWITMVTSGGISGGAMEPPDSISWGNDLITYCRNYVNMADSLTETSICFKYNSSLVSPSALQRAADIWLFSDVVNHWVIFSVNFNQHLTIISYGSVTDSLASLVSGHWYRLVASFKTLSLSPGDWVSAQAEVFDLGLSGTASPVSVARNTSVFQDSDLVQSARFEVKVSGARFGGGELLDDFSYRGLPGTSTCSLTGIEPVGAGDDAFTIYPQPAHDGIMIQSKIPAHTKNQVLHLYDALGQIKAVQEEFQTPFYISLSSLPVGMYFLEIRREEKIFRSKMMKH